MTVQTSAPVPNLTIEIPGVLRNPLRGSRGHWRRHAAWAKTWRTDTSVIAVATVNARYRAEGSPAWPSWPWADPARPKRVTFHARVRNLLDDDNLRAALKPVRDGLRDANVIQADDPRSGHEFAYDQVIDRRRPGVTITVTLTTTRSPTT